MISRVPPYLPAVLVLALAVGRVDALSSDREQPIDIVADRAEADERERVTIYRGDAVITQGTLRITGDTVWIYFSEDDEFVKLVSVGEPARMRQLPDGAEDFQTADAKRLEYYAEKNLILLLGDAVYGQGKDRISADRIEYDSLQGRMLARTRPERSQPAAGGEPESGERPRVRIRIVPKKDKKKE